MSEVARFREWAETHSRRKDRDVGEWACDYRQWRDLYRASLQFINAKPFSEWRPEELGAVLYVIAHDDENEHIVRELQHLPETLFGLANASVLGVPPQAAWQLATRLGFVEEPDRSTAERLLLRLVNHDDEYVRRRSLEGLARLGSSAVEGEAIRIWNREHDENEPGARAMVLWCLHKVGSQRLEGLLTEAEQSEDSELAKYAKKVRAEDARWN